MKKQPMQANGKGTRGKPDPAAQDRTSGRADPGESGGGAYPNPWTGKKDGSFGTWTGHGGQSVPTEAELGADISASPDEHGVPARKEK